MAPNAPPPNTEVKFSAINPEAFKEGFSVDALLAYLGKDVLKGKLGSRGNLEGAIAHQTAKASLEKVNRLLSTFNRAEEELQQLQREVFKKVAQLQASVGRQQAEYKDVIDRIEEDSEHIRGAYKELEGRMNKISQVGTRIGDRLQTADSLRSKGLQMVDLIEYLQQLSVLDEQEDFRKLPRIFWDDKQLPGAAVVARKLMALTAEAHNAKQRSRLVGAEDTKEQATEEVKGSLEYTTRRLEHYCNWLEQRVLTRFDDAVANGDAKIMAECVGIMVGFDREKSIIQRYVSCQPIFQLDQAEVLAHLPKRPATEKPALIRAAMQVLDDMYALLLSTVQEQVAVMLEVFPEPRRALDLLVRRMLEERVQPALDSLLEMPEQEDSSQGQEPAAPQQPAQQQLISSKGQQPAQQQPAQQQLISSKALQLQLQLLVEVRGRTVELVKGMEQAAAGLLHLHLLQDSLFVPYLSSYPGPELQCLKLKFQEAAEGLPTSELHSDLVQTLIACNAEAVGRAAVLSSAGVLPYHVRLLFHGNGPFEPATGCLLEQLASHIIDGVDYSLEVCGLQDPRAEAQAEAQAQQQALAMAAAAAAAAPAAGAATAATKGAPAAPNHAMQASGVSKISSMQAAEGFVAARICKALEAARVASAMMLCLQSHYSDVVVPQLGGSLAELSLCNSGLLTLLRAVEESVLTVLQRCIDSVIVTAAVAQAELTLMWEQRRSEFLPGPNIHINFEKPTDACMLVTAMITAVRHAAQDNLEGANLVSFLTEVGNRLHALMLNHMQQYTFNANGALRWKSDVLEYTECVRAFEVLSVLERFISLQGLVNVLMVAPESLLVLVNGALRLEHREALRFIALREDFLTARVEGRTLQQLFDAADLRAGPAPVTFKK